MKKLVFWIIIFMGIEAFSLEITEIDSINLGNIIYPQKRVLFPKETRISVKGIPGRVVIAEADEGVTLNSRGTIIRIEKITFENTEIMLDKNGKGVFRIGGVVSVLKYGRKKELQEEVRVTVRYKGGTEDQ